MLGLIPARLFLILWRGGPISGGDVLGKIAPPDGSRSMRPSNPNGGNYATLAAEGRIAPDLEIKTVAKLFSLIGDGLFMRRAVDALALRLAAVTDPLDWLSDAERREEAARIQGWV